MEHTKKMFLINPEVFQKMQDSNEIGPKTLSQLDDEMQIILNSKVNDREKWNKYNQVLQRFLHFSNNYKQPIPIATIENNGDVENPPKKTPHRLPVAAIVESVPKTLRNKTNLLLQTIENSNNISWDENGYVYVNNEKIPESNIIDIINNTMRDRKTNQPKGTETFLMALKNLNVPLEFIGNPKLRNYIAGSYNYAAGSTPDTSKATTPGFVTPVQDNLSKRLNKSRDISWETPFK